MTHEERAKQMKERNEAIVVDYAGGRSLAEVASTFRMCRQRVLQIVQEAGVWRPYVKNGRNKHLGVVVTDKLHATLSTAAAQQGVSVSKLTSDLLEEATKGDR